MNRILVTLAALLAALPFTVKAANPAYGNFNTNQFGSNNFNISIKGTALFTNGVFYGMQITNLPGSGPFIAVDPFGNAYLTNAAAASTNTPGTVFISTTNSFWIETNGFVTLIVYTNRTMTIATNSPGFYGFNSNNVTMSYVVIGFTPPPTNAAVGISAATYGLLLFRGGNGGDGLLSAAGTVNGGNGAPITMTGGNGGVNDFGTTNASGGGGGAMQFSGGNGGPGQTAAGVATNQINGGAGGAFVFNAGNGGSPAAPATNTIGGSGGTVTFVTGNGGSPTAGWARKGGNGGTVNFKSGNGGASVRTNGGSGGTFNIQPGNGGAATTSGNGGAPGVLNITGGTGADGAGGGTNSDGGNINIAGGTPGTGAIPGQIFLNSPTTVNTNLTVYEGYRSSTNPIFEDTEFVTAAFVRQEIDNIFPQQLYSATNAHASNSVWATMQLVNPQQWTNSQTLVAGTTNLAARVFTNAISDGLSAGTYIWHTDISATPLAPQVVQYFPVLAIVNTSATNFLATGAVATVTAVIAGYDFPITVQTNVSVTGNTNFLAVLTYSIRSGGAGNPTISVYGGGQFASHLDTPTPQFVSGSTAVAVSTNDILITGLLTNANWIDGNSYSMSISNNPAGKLGYKIVPTFTLSTNTPATTTNFVANFAQPYSIIFPTADVNFMHSTGRLEGQWLFSVTKIYAGNANRQLWLNTNWTCLGGTTNNMILTAGHTAIVSLAQDGSNETNVCAVISTNAVAAGQ